MRRLTVVVIVVLALLVSVALVVGILACGVCRRGQPTGQPTVRLLSPPDGTQIAVNRQIYVQARAFARGNVSRIDFAVNGNSIGSQSPSGSQRLFAAAQPWTASSAGTYTLAVTAYDAAGQASAPAQVTITVLESGSFVPPSGTPVPGGPSPTPWSGSGPSPTPTTPSGGWGEPSVDFRADRTSLQAGECTTLRWDTEYVQEVYLDGAGVSGHGTRDVCPSETTTYVLLVVLPSGESRDYAVTIEVTGETTVTGPNLAVLAVACPGGQSDESIPFQAQVQNQGDQAAQNAQWRWSVNSAGAGPGQWNQGGTFDLPSGDTTLLQGSIPPQPAGNWTVYVEVRVDGDTVPGNNQGSANFTVTGPQGDGDAAPAAPTNLRVPSWGMNYIRLTWDDNSDNEDGFQVFQQGRQDPVAQTGPNENQVQIDNPPCGQTLQFRVRASNAAGNSDYSNVVEVQTAPCGPGGEDLAVTSVTASVSPATFSGPCPHTINFSGQIAANGPGEVTYRWERSNGNMGPIKSVTFDTAGTKTVTSANWELTQSGTYWAKLHVLTPNAMSSTQAKFTLNCAAAGEVTSVSVSVNPIAWEGPCPKTVTFNGSIRTSGPCTVQYQWVRDVTPGSTKSITFDAAGTKTVTGDWKLNQSGTYEMWLNITAPNRTVSNRAQFQLTCTNVAPAAPSNLRVVKRTKNSITLKWNDNSDNEQIFIVEEVLGGRSARVGAGTTQFEFPFLPCGTDFRFRVRAEGEHGVSEPSNEVETSTRDC